MTWRLAKEGGGRQFSGLSLNCLRTSAFDCSLYVLEEIELKLTTRGLKTAVSLRLSFILRNPSIEFLKNVITVGCIHCNSQARQHMNLIASYKLKLKLKLNRYKQNKIKQIKKQIKNIQINDFNFNFNLNQFNLIQFQYHALSLFNFGRGLKLCRSQELKNCTAKTYMRYTQILDHIRIRIDITTPMHCPRLKRLYAKLSQPSQLIMARFREKEQQSTNPTITTAAPRKYMFLRKQLIMTRMMTKKKSLFEIRRMFFFFHFYEQIMKNKPPKNQPAPSSMRILKVRLLSQTGVSPQLNTTDIRTEMNVQMKAMMVPEQQKEGIIFFNYLFDEGRLVYVEIYDTASDALSCLVYIYY